MTPDLAPWLQPIILAVTISWAFWKYLQVKSYNALKRKHNAQEAPWYPHKDPILGTDLLNVYTKAFETGTFLETNRKHFALYGKTFKTKMFGQVIIKTMDAENNKAIFATNFQNFGLEPLRKHVAPNLFGNGVIMVDGPAWAHARSLIRSSFDVVHVANFTRLQNHTGKFMELVPKDGSTINLAPLFKRLILDTSSEFILGQSINALTSESQSKPFLDAFAYAQRGTGIRSVLGRLYFLHRDRKWFEACKTVTDFCDKHVDEAFQRLENPESISRNERGRLRLVDEMAKDSRDRFTLRSQLIAVFSPAHDGAATVLTNLFFHLARKPDLYQRLRMEILPSQGKELDYDLLRTYTFLHSCIRETLRLTTVATINQRVCLSDCVLPRGGGLDGKAPLVVRKGEVLEINYRAIHLDEDYWGADVDKFNPDRWDSMRPTWEFTPFGGGARTCPGLRLVYTESAYVAVVLLREFSSLECRDDDLEWREEMRMTAQSKNGCKVGLIQ